MKAEVAVASLIMAGMAALGLAIAAAAESDAPRPRKSGADFMGESTRAMQRDDTQNPAMLWVGDGEALWRTKAGAGNKACADCHGRADAAMRGVAATYPRFQQEAAGVVTLGQRINHCRERHQQLSLIHI